ncbi:MAG: hypothetical protein QJR00_00385 [Bacillota bacterium]|nr:hypothetical protein [Bacillota bacterium]
MVLGWLRPHRHPPVDHGLAPAQILLAFLALFLLTGPFLGGCVDMVDANRDVLVYGLGLDAGEEGGVVVTLHFLSPSGASGGGSPVGSLGTGASPSVQPVTLSSGGKTFNDALEKLRFQVPGRIYLGDVWAIFFGEELTHRGLGEIMDALLRETFTLNSAYVLFTEGEAARFLAHGPHGTSSALAALSIFDGDAARTVPLHPMTLWQLYNAVWTDYWVDWGPLVTVTPSDAKVVGHVLLRSGRWQTSLPIGEDGTLLTSIRPGGRAQLTLPLAGGLGSFRFAALTTASRVRGREVEVTIRGSASLVEWRGETHPPLQELELLLSDALRDRMEGFLKRMYREQKIDVLNLAEKVRSRSPGGVLPGDLSQTLADFTFVVIPKVTLSDTARSH